jgi:anaerobic ribonucleoside-triphosphate reductase activating protein
MTTDELLREVMDDEFADVTFSGGDPMMQASGFAELACAIRQNCFKTIWCYTGYRFEWLVRQEDKLPLLRQIDVLVDGPFVQSLKDPDLLFRGSSNQRIIDVRRSLREDRAVVMTDGQALGL